MMLIPVFCGECVKAALASNTLLVEEHMVPVAEIQDEPVYQVKCSKGHNTKCLVQHVKFELLFDLGFNALIDGYYREAVSSFASALERLYEFAIRIFISDSATDELFEQTWKKVANQSERQLGAFLFLYLDKIKKIPAVLSENDILFRNRVIHKGYISSKDESVAFGEAVRTIANEVISCMRNLYGSKLDSAYDRLFDQFRNRADIEFSCTVTPILDAKHGPTFASEDVRNRPLLDMASAALERRKPHRMRFFKDKESLQAAQRASEQGGQGA
jgi:hypothetical protein